MDAIEDFTNAALECSIYLSPEQPGLTQEELTEVCQQAGFRPGEINDAIRQQDFGTATDDRCRLLPVVSTLSVIHWFTNTEDPDYRNRVAAEFVLVSIRDAVKEFGRGAARVDRGVLVEKGIRAGFSRHDVQLAVTLYVVGGVLSESEGSLAFRPNKERWVLPSGNPPTAGPPREMPNRARAYPIVRTLVSRRSEGLSVSPEPLAAFAGQLEQLGYPGFRMWWLQLTGELQRSEPANNTVAACVIAAALVEGALVFVVRHARANGQGPMNSTTFKEPPTAWNLKDLVNSAAAGGADAILDNNAKNRAETLIRTRQRIHAGRMLFEFPTGPEDLRPEEARDAKATADLVVRRILDWLQKHPVRSDGLGQ